MKHCFLPAALAFACAHPVLLSASTLVAGVPVFQGSIARVPLTLSAVPVGGLGTGALQWTTVVPNAKSVTVEAGPAAVSAGKTIACNTATGACILAGANLATLANGVVATAVVDVSNNPTATYNVQLSNPMEALADGTAGVLSVTGGTIVPPPPVQPAQLSNFTCALSVIAPGASTQCTVTLTTNSGGAVALTSSSASWVPAPSTSITVAAGALSATFTVAAAANSPDHPALLTASLGGVSKQVTITVRAPTAVSLLVCTPTTLRGGERTTCTVTISSTSGEFPFPVSLASSNASLLAVPASFSIPSWSTSAAFTATSASTIGADQLVTLTAGGTKTAAIQLLAPTILSSLTCAAAQIAPKASTTCTVRLTSPAPAAGQLVSLSTSSQSISIPTGLRVQAGSLTRAFTATAATAAPAQTVTLTAFVSTRDRVATSLRIATATSAVSGGVRLSCAPRLLFAGMEGTCTVSVDTPVEDDTTALRVSAAGGALVPRDVAILPGAASATFAFTTSAALGAGDGASSVVRVEGPAASTVDEQQLRILPPPELYLRGQPAELDLDGHLRPAVAPEQLQGRAVGPALRFAGLAEGDGMEFAAPTQLRFDGRAVGGLFSDQGGEISFLFEPSSSASSAVARAPRRLFGAFDGRQGRAWMAAIAGRGGELELVYSIGAGGTVSRYRIPAGAAAGAVAVRLEWSASKQTVALWLDDALVQSGRYDGPPGSAEWLDTSYLAIGPLADGDKLARFLIRREGSSGVNQ